MQTWILYGLGFTILTDITDSVVSNLLLTAACILISNNLKYYLPQQRRYTYLLIMCLLTSGAWLLAIKYALPLVIVNESGYDAFLVKSLSVRFGVAFLVIDCMTMISVIWYGFEDQKTSAQRKTEAEKLTKDAELYKLRQQLQPHFLFNSLNSINALIGFKPDEARRMIHQLSDFLRGTLKKDDQQRVTLTEELEHLNLYLEIEKVRFGHRLKTEISCDDNCGSAILPALMLQPIVENAIKFGLYDTTDDVVVSIRAEMEGSYLQLMVQNPYDPQTSRPKQGTGFGLRGVQRRLYLLFARNDLMETHANDNIFTTIIKVPQL